MIMADKREAFQHVEIRASVAGADSTAVVADFMAEAADLTVAVEAITDRSSTRFYEVPDAL
jgi:hypothetical protein